MEGRIKRIARTKVDGYTVNTTIVNGQYETAIKLEDRNYIVVQRYETLTHAEIGHKHWSEFCKSHPIYAVDVVENKQKLF